jgi:SAM-dependent methyltransferase
MERKPKVLDLFCGRGGWARGLKLAGYHVTGLDNEPGHAGAYPGDAFIIADVRQLPVDAGRFDLIVASPPCLEFSRHDMPWTRSKNPPPPDISLFRAAEALRGRGVPVIIENVRGAGRWVGGARAHYGPFFLWGDVPAMLPAIAPRFKKKESYGSKDQAKRAEIPTALGRFIGQCFYPEQIRGR